MASPRTSSSGPPNRSSLLRTTQSSHLPQPTARPAIPPVVSSLQGAAVASSSVHAFATPSRSPPRSTLPANFRLFANAAGPQRPISRGPLTQSAPGLSHTSGNLTWTTDETVEGDGEVDSASEWSINGLEVPLRRIRHLLLDDADASDIGNGSADAATTAASLLMRPFSSLGNSQVAAYSFGGEPPRWQFEIIRNAPSASGVGPAPPSDSIHDPLLAPTLPAQTHVPGGLSLYLTCPVLDRDYPSADLAIPTEIMLGVRDKAARSTAADRWLWRTWQTFVFSPEAEYWHTQSLNIADIIARHPRPITIDNLVLSLQVSSPTGQASPHFQDAHIVPKALLQGIESMLDDPGTGDVLITVCEASPTPSSPSLGSDLSTPGDGPQTASLYRRRVIYAHSAILRARGGYFDAMFGTETWAEAGETVAGRRRHRLTITDFNFETVWWMLRWLYTSEIRFAECEDVRTTLNEHAELPDGLLGNGPNALGWNWQPLSSSVRRGHPGDEPRGVFGRVSPVSSTGRVSPVQVRIPSAASSSSHSHRIASSRTAKMTEEKGSSPNAAALAKAVPPTDPHPHPAPMPSATSALNTYRLAHRCELAPLASLALEHLVTTLTPKTAFPLLLATELWPELHQAVQQYTLANWPIILETAKDEVQRCYEEIGMGLWERAGITLFEFTQLLSKSIRPA